MERETGFEPATSTLARSHSTTELLPLSRAKSDYIASENEGQTGRSGVWVLRNIACPKLKARRPPPTLSSPGAIQLAGDPAGLARMFLVEGRHAPSSGAKMGQGRQRIER